MDLTLACRSIAPTVAVVSAETAAKLHSTTSATPLGGIKKLGHYFESRMLAAGRLPTESFLTGSSPRVNLGTTPGKLRLLLVSERVGLNTPPLTSNDLSDLRIYTKARVVYALTAAKVAGAVAQTNVYDYRRGDTLSSKHSHFGVPLSSLEIKLKDTVQHRTTDDKSAGEIIVTGSSVAGGEAALGVNGKCTYYATSEVKILTHTSYLPRRSHAGLRLRDSVHISFTTNMIISSPHPKR